MDGAEKPALRREVGSTLGKQAKLGCGKLSDNAKDTGKRQASCYVPDSVGGACVC